MEPNASYEIKNLTRLIENKIFLESKKSEGVPLSYVQMKILHYLFHHQNEIVYQKDIEKLIDVKRSTISGILNTMEKNNLIHRLSVNNDARLKQIVLAEAAQKKVVFFQSKAKELKQLLEKNIKKEDLEIFYKVISQMKENMKG